jgi:hypothetical protein
MRAGGPGTCKVLKRVDEYSEKSVNELGGTGAKPPHLAMT